MESSRNTSTLILAAHGATDDPRCAAPVHRHAAAIRAMGLFENVLCIFWKERPFFRDLYALTAAESLLIVPVMTASGYYANTVLPRELSLSEAPAGRNLRIAPAVGESDAMAEIIIEQAAGALSRHAQRSARFRLNDAHVLLIGHGTWRDPERSGATTYRHANSVRRRGILRDVHVGFLEQAPLVKDAFDVIPGDEPVIVVPFLIANGGHGADDIPAEIAKASGRRRVIFADAVGESPRMVDLILNAAGTIGASLEGGGTGVSAVRNDNGEARGDRAATPISGGTRC